MREPLSLSRFGGIFDLVSGLSCDTDAAPANDSPQKNIRLGDRHFNAIQGYFAYQGNIHWSPVNTHFTHFVTVGLKFSCQIALK